MTSKSFVLIGAGSTVFTPGLMTDLASSAPFAGWTVHLVDLDPDAADTMARVGRRIAAERGADLTFVPHTERREALPGARFVAATIAVGGASGWLRDVEIPARHGVAQTVGDSVGPGGVLRALRHVPELVAIAGDVADLAPDALVINYSNPLTANVRAMTAATPVRAIGLCHGTMHTLATIARELAVPVAEVDATFAGLNHLCWLLELRHAGHDLYPRWQALVESRAGTADARSTRSEGSHLAVSADLYRIFGRYPAPGDRHVAEFFGWYLRGYDGGPVAGDALRWGLQGGRDATLEYIGEKADLWEGLHAQADGTRALPRTDNQEAERLVAIATAVITGHDHRELAVNLPNEGLVDNLPAEAVVEVPALVGASGVRGQAVGPLPTGIAAALSARAQQQEIVVQAALQGRRDLALQALALDPLVPDPGRARAILDDAVAADAADEATGWGRSVGPFRRQHGDGSVTAVTERSIESTVTYAEIAQQPAVWRELDARIIRRQGEIAEFLDPLLERPELRIILSGAGTSAFVGEILAPALTRRLGRRVEAVATTDVVADPHGVFAVDVPTLMISFARSGDSPESVAATELAEQCLGEVHHLLVTCNPGGRLARDHGSAASSLVLLMPTATNDRGFAMTSSFTSMLLATWLVFTVGDEPTMIDRLASSASIVLSDLGSFAEVATRGYARVVFLGSGPLAGLAHEAALKLLELTAGRVVSYFDTALGFRHGPKSVLDEHTLVLAFCSTDSYTARYDRDIVTELRATVGPTVIMVSADPAAGRAGDWLLDGAAGLADVPVAALYAVTAQLFALHTSLALGCTPDNPFPSGEVNRVVQGVTVHPLS